MADDRPTSRHRRVLNQEFDRTAASFDERTRGRFDDLHVLEFARLRPGGTVAEVGSGTGAFLSLFGEPAGLLIGVDLTMGMLLVARRRNPAMKLLLADGGRLPLASRSVDLVASAQAFHHMEDPVGVLKEMRRVVADHGAVLVVDQVATERFEESMAMNELEKVRDPSHVAARPPSAFRVMFRACGLEIVDERIVLIKQRMSRWMAPDEFPPERFDAVERFIEERGPETGMRFRKEAGEWTFERHRMMLLGRRRTLSVRSSGSGRTTQGDGTSSG
jgi:SAM-dependent methyltransferase